MKITIECSEKEASLIQQALELYTRVGLLQFDYLTYCGSLQELIWKNKLNEEFRQKTDELKSIFGYSSNSNPGIFNKDIVKDDCRQAANMYQQIRHEFWKNNDNHDKPKYTVNAYPADICKIAEIPEPNFKIKIEDENNSNKV